MIKISATDVITSLFDQFMSSAAGKELPPDVGMYFEVAVTCANFGYERDGNTHHPEWERRFAKCVHIIVLSNHRVYVSVTDPHKMRGLKNVDPSSFVNTSNHSSCWRSDGLRTLSEVAGEAFDYCFGFMPPEHARTPAEAALNIRNQLGQGLWKDNPVAFVRVKRQRIEQDTYRDALTAIHPVQFRVQFDSF